MNTAHVESPEDWQDSLANWAEANAAELRHFTGSAHRALPLPKERQWVAPQGRPEQGWPARRCSVEPTVIDRLPEAHDPPEPVVGRELAKVWLVLMTPGVTVLAGLCAWAWVHFHA